MSLDSQDRPKRVLAALVREYIASGEPVATSSDDATGSPEAMYSRTSAASTRFGRSWESRLISGYSFVFGSQTSRLLTPRLYTGLEPRSPCQRFGRRPRL